MAFKKQSQVAQAVTEQRVENMEFRIEGAWLVDAGEGQVTIRLDNVPVMHVAWQAIGRILEDAGLDQRQAEGYVDDLAEMVQTDTMAKLLAQRAKRIG